MYLENLNAKPILWILIGIAAIFAAVILVSFLTKASKKKSGGVSAAEQKEMEENLKAIEEEKQKEAAKRNLKEKVEAQRQATIRQEVFERLEAQRLAAEAEEGKTSPKKAAKKAAVKEEPVKEEAAVAEEKPAKKAPAKKAPAKKVEAVEEKPAKKAPAKKVEAVEEKPAKKAPAKKAPAKKVEKVEEKVVEETPVLTDDSDTDTLARYAGKWAVYHILTDDEANDDDMYFFELHASNGEKLLSSEEYTSYQGAVRGIETHKTNILKGNFKITLSKKGDYIVKLLSGSGQLLCTGENYANKARCESAIKSIKRFARTAIVDENVQDYFLKVPKDTETYVAPAMDGVNGKWIISSREDSDGDKVFFFELFANNGEKLLSSEEYTTYAGAVNGIQTHKQNIAKDNFRITLTKKGDYIYKILNGNGQLLCLGEHYKSKARCQSAVDSVKRFAETSPVLTESDQVKD